MKVFSTFNILHVVHNYYSSHIKYISIYMKNDMTEKKTFPQCSQDWYLFLFVGSYLYQQLLWLYITMLDLIQQMFTFYSLFSFRLQHKITASTNVMPTLHASQAPFSVLTKHVFSFQQIFSKDNCHWWLPTA